ncbi:hypothetical protein WN53_03165 [Serratia fonticola]|nr:hypothetical protein WN53_03165 [Serratia fonticola]
MGCWVIVMLMFLGVAEASQESFIMFDVTVMAPTCTINDNREIAVDFGTNVIISHLGEYGYKLTPIIFTLNCAAPGNYSFMVQGAGAVFDEELLATNKQQLGIEITYDGRRLPLNTRLSFTYPNIPVLQAQPIASKIGLLAPGEFSATASVRVSYD